MRVGNFKRVVPAIGTSVLSGDFSTDGNIGTHASYTTNYYVDGNTANANASGGICTVTLDENDTDDTRTEVGFRELGTTYFDPDPFNQDRSPKNGQRIVYQWDMRIPADWEEDDIAGGAEIFNQFAQFQDAGEETTHLNPTIEMKIEAAKYRLSKRATPVALVPNVKHDKYHRVNNDIDLGSWAGDAGKWVTWTWEILWSFNTDGYMFLWKNEDIIFRDTGATYSNDQYGPVFKVGIYRPDGWSNSTLSTKARSLDIDNVEIYVYT